jgi:DNA-binding response OmpR family regulator
MPAQPPVILLIGHDATLTYLIGRYAERSGYDVHLSSSVPSSAEVCDLQPAALLFSSIEHLEAAQTLIADLSSCELPLLVCSSINDQVRARELGADYCLVHPLTYDSFIAALTAISSPPAAKRQTRRQSWA